ncbi:MAG: DNA-methyltransferase [Candidatus Hodarchaeales archaeon]
MKKDEIICGEASKILKDFPSDSIDLTVTSPPYDNIRKYEGFEFDYKSILEELYRVTKEGGVVVWVIGDSTIKGSETGTSFKHALHAKEIGFNLHDTMIYEKINPIPIYHNRYAPCFEYMFIFVKGKLKTFNPIRENCIHAGLIDNRSNRRSGDSYSIQKRNEIYAVNTVKTKRNIWRYKIGGTFKKEEHPAVFPDELAEDHILSWSNEGDLILEGDLVLDPMCGSGTTCVMAKKNGRHYIGIDISEKYCEKSRERIENYEHRSGGLKFENSEDGY